jgi:hypothetical protein
MNIGVALVFDEDTELAIRGVWQSIADAGMPSFMLGLDYPPHMTLFMAEKADLPGLRAALTQQAARTPPLPVSFPALAHFMGGGSVAFLAPIINRPLLDLHETFWQAAELYTTNRPAYYAPGIWVPHVTVAFNTPPEEVGAVAAVLVRQPPLEGKISAGCCLARLISRAEVK